MHSPETLAFSIKNPFCRQEFKPDIISIWHVDPCKGPGGDDTCGWFKRAHHGDPEVLKKIEDSFEWDWDRTFTSEGKVYYCGLFKPSGHPHHSVTGIVIQLFFLAAGQYFAKDGQRNWKRSRKWMQDHLFEIMQFAENPVDSLFDSITRKFEDGCGESQTDRLRKERIHNMASIIYGWILRAEQKWWQHPRWHFWHWQIQIHPLVQFKRWAFSRCCKCHKRFTYGYSPVTNNWNSKGPMWFKSEPDVYHSDCNRPQDSCLKQE